jgi:hypothetical protein
MQTAFLASDIVCAEDSEFASFTIADMQQQ